MKSWTVRALVVATVLLCVAATVYAQGEVAHERG